MANELAKTTGTMALAQLSRDQVELLKRTVCRGATDDELQLFLHACNHMHLDPFLKQIHAVKRWDSKLEREVMSIQIGIDGFRLIADRTGKYAGSDEPKYGDDDKDGNPSSATVTVYKIVEGQRIGFTATAYFDEYKQTKKDGGLIAMWAKMPRNQIAKCAEGLALRKAFPAELGSVRSEEEMAQQENPGPTVDQPKRKSEKLKDATPEDAAASTGGIPGNPSSTSAGGAAAQEEPGSNDGLDDEPAGPGPKTITGTVEKISQKATKNPNSPRYSISISGDDGVFYTFDKDFMELCRKAGSAPKKPVVVEYVSGKYGRDIESVKFA